MKKSLLKHVISLLLATCFSLPFLTACESTCTVNYYHGDTLLYSEEVKKDTEYSPTYEFNVELFEFKGWVDESGSPFTSKIISADTNIYAESLPTIDLISPVGAGTSANMGVYDTGDTVFLQVQVPELEGWSYDYSISHPDDVIVSERTTGKLKGYDLYLVSAGRVIYFTVNYTNGFDTVSATKKIYFEHWNVHLGFYFMPGEPVNYSETNFYENTDFYTSYNVPLNGKVVFEDMRIRLGNRVYRDAVIDNVVIEDESVLSFDKEQLAFVGLKAGTTKVTVYGKWHQVEWDDWSNVRPDPPKTYEGSGSRNLKREMTITVA